MFWFCKNNTFYFEQKMSYFELEKVNDLLSLTVPYSGQRIHLQRISGFLHKHFRLYKSMRRFLLKILVSKYVIWILTDIIYRLVYISRESTTSLFD